MPSAYTDSALVAAALMLRKRLCGVAMDSSNFSAIPTAANSECVDSVTVFRPGSRVPGFVAYTIVDIPATLLSCPTLLLLSCALAVSDDERSGVRPAPC